MDLKVEVEALKAFKNTITNDPFGALVDWNDANHHCNWSGIECDTSSGHAISISLVDKQLEGAISPFLGNLSSLQVLDLTLNSFTGKIPPQLGSCTQLTQLVLYQNYLTGSIPAELGNLKSLQTIDFGNNFLNGSIPDSLCNCTALLQLGLVYNNLTGIIPSKNWKLTLLNVYSNQFTGGIPPELGNLVNLEALRLYDNKLNSTIPHSLFKMKSLTHLGLSQNELVGNIPSEIGSLSALEVLTLHLNRFTGEIPSTITNLSNLTYLSVGFNSLTGSLPKDIGFLYNLKNLTMNDNLIEGSIPSSIINCTRLLVITLTSNRFTGKIPEGLGQLSNLTYLSLGNNKISGNIPDDLFNCSKLEVLDLSQNNISGTLKPNIGRLVQSPPELSKLTLLQGLALNDNELEGLIPENLSELKQLTDLRLQNNKFVGPIPRAILKLESLSWLDLSGNKLNGLMPKSLASLSRLTTLDLSRNNISGSIPGSLIASVKNLQIYLNLSYNFLDKTIPDEIGMLNMVQVIDLSNNNLSGSIPRALKGCRNLISLDLSGNNFSSQVPREIFHQLNELVKLNLSRNQLNGALPENLASLRHLSSLDLSQNKFEGIIPESLANISLKYLNISFNLLEGRVPEAGVFGNISSTSLQGNPALCGTKVLKSCSTEKNLKSFHHLGKKKWFILTALGCVFILIILLLAIYAVRQKIKKQKTENLEDPKLEFRSGLTLKRFGPKDIEVATNFYSENNIIGASTISTVFKGTLEDGQVIAVKKLNIHQFLEVSDKCFNREVKILGQLRHKNLVKVLGYAWESRNLRVLVLEFMENGSLEKIIHDSNKDNPSWTLRERIDAIVSIASGLAYLHSGYDFPIVHCDLKPSNILLDAKMEAHVSDFGTARMLGIHLEDGSSISSASAFEGTIGYIAPEFAYMRKVTTKVDIFSFGMIVMELITLKRPTGLTGEEGLPITLSQLVQKALEYGINGVLQIVDPQLALYTTKKPEVLEGLLHLALSCTSTDPENRPDMEKVLSSLSKLSKMV
ncbi:LRR receptor-like serine/threonine-protein kinase FLS2 [Abeliophyllum distichum]|uniref:non-specific serine/threonine protein kinase n=1 Tax=Abeliophyllum distichum TaxID=126358 RepID=A0ABD1UGZ7_9LAMI